MEEDNAAELVLDATKRLYSRSMNTTLSGNVSHRIGKDRMLITPSGMDKARIKASELSVIELGSESLVSGPKQSSEYHVHTRIYRMFPEIQAVVHPHAPHSMGVISALGAKAVIDEISDSDEEYGYYITKAASVGIMKAGTVEIGDAVANAVKNGAKVVIMENHGTVGVGETMQKALDRVEYFEYMVKRLHIRHLEELCFRPSR